MFFPHHCIYRSSVGSGWEDGPATRYLVGVELD